MLSSIFIEIFHCSPLICLTILKFEIIVIDTKGALYFANIYDIRREKIAVDQLFSTYVAVSI